MLKELVSVKQHAGQSFRRWFTDRRCDLIVWHDADRVPDGFQLIYRDFADEHAFTWRPQDGLSHHQVDDGEGRPYRAKMSPILISGDFVDYENVLKEFRDRCGGIERDLSRLVIEALSHQMTLMS